MTATRLEKKLDFIETSPSVAAKASIIILHGLGADGYDFMPITDQLNLPATLPIRFIFPHAPMRPVSLNGGMTMRAWFDIYGLTAGSFVDEAGIQSCESVIHQLIEQEVTRGVPTEKIVLAGFSQGGAIALHAGLRYPKKLAGILGLSTLLPLAEKLTEETASANKQTPIMLTHGLYDNVLDISLGETSKNILTQLGYHVNWHSYPMGHSVCAEEIVDIKQWLLKILAD